LWGSEGIGSLHMMVCARCGHTNQPEARFCSSCGAPLATEDDATTLTLSAVEAADLEDELVGYLDDLPPGVGLLVLRHGPESGSTYRLDADTTTIGRHPDSDVFLDDITVSRRHVEVVRRGPGDYVLRDVGSLNGTYVNRQRVDEAPLAHLDEVQIGRYRLSFVLGGAEDGA
jgi:hypothetical protein